MAIITRATNILLQPKSEWEVVYGENSSKGGLYLGYVLPLSAIGPVAYFLGISVIGFGPFRMPMQYGLSTAIVTWVMALVSVFIVASVIDGLATSFYGKKDSERALKLATYSFTPAWLGGILMVFPSFGILSLLASAYAIYLLYLGLPVLMESPRDKALPYTGAVVIAAIVAQLILGSVTGALLGAPGMQPAPTSQATPELGILSPSEQETLRKLTETAQQMQAEQERRKEKDDQGG